ncbi:protein SCO1/2 [Burkholderia sp. WP9]|uniref:SCO family protein n=1 Tax=Burkholderia sp. WP9 TaxID=1500263 RepID=UPI000898EB19|nr:SCO family protein [Burkholderia sp. WP9]SEF12563.1 protein SCO1/2 [Burkholderia sp. WP9]
MPNSTAPADSPLARRLTVAVCAALLATFVWGLYRYTANFGVWTFEGQRQQALQAGELRAAQVPLREMGTASVTLWRGTKSAPAAYLVDFIYTRCPSVCRVLGDEYQQMQAQLVAQRARNPALAAVHLVSISFDAEHDDPASLRAYAREHRIDPALWTLAMPATAADTQALMRSLEVIAIPDGLGGFVHNGAIHLLDASGRLRGLYEFDQWPLALEAAKQLATARREIP